MRLFKEPFPVIDDDEEELQLHFSQTHAFYSKSICRRKFLFIDQSQKLLFINCRLDQLLLLLIVGHSISSVLGSDSQWNAKLLMSFERFCGLISRSLNRFVRKKGEEEEVWECICIN